MPSSQTGLERPFNRLGGPALAAAMAGAMGRAEFAKRRKRLMRQMGGDTVAILPAAAPKRRNRDVEYPYRQDSDFYYLTGFPEPEAVAVLVPGRPHGEYLLFNRPRDPKQEVWTGRRAGQEGACADYGADDSFPVEDLNDILPGLLEDKQRVYYTLGSDTEFDGRVMDCLNQVRAKARTGVHAPCEFVSLDCLVHEMRLLKNAAELASLREAARISVAAHERAMRVCRPGLMEYEIESELLHEFGRAGGRSPAYPPIVAGGASACVLHYTSNDSVLREGDLLLIDAGAEYDYYAADITRTFPVNGRFTPPQRALYQLVLEAQRAAIRAVRPGARWNQPHDAVVETLCDGLARLGILKGDVGKAIKKHTYRRFFMHRTGHWLGMDVHDVGQYKVGDQWRAFEPGMVLTVEPGLYIAPGTKGVAKKWWGMGIRIEDDVLVTELGCEVLTEALPKEAEALEDLMASGARAV